MLTLPLADQPEFNFNTSLSAASRLNGKTGTFFVNQNHYISHPLKAILKAITIQFSAGSYSRVDEHQLLCPLPAN
jgi:hypothetical protein